MGYVRVMLRRHWGAAGAFPAYFSGLNYAPIPFQDYSSFPCTVAFAQETEVRFQASRFCLYCIVAFHIGIFHSFSLLLVYFSNVLFLAKLFRVTEEWSCPQTNEKIVSPAFVPPTLGVLPSSADECRAFKFLLFLPFLSSLFCFPTILRKKTHDENPLLTGLVLTVLG